MRVHEEVGDHQVPGKEAAGGGLEGARRPAGVLRDECQAGSAPLAGNDLEEPLLPSGICFNGSECKQRWTVIFTAELSGNHLSIQPQEMYSVNPGPV